MLTSFSSAMMWSGSADSTWLKLTSLSRASASADSSAGMITARISISLWLLLWIALSSEARLKMSSTV